MCQSELSTVNFQIKIHYQVQFQAISDLDGTQWLQQRKTLNVNLKTDLFIQTI